MFSKIMAIFMCIISSLPAPLSQFFSEATLKYELSQGFYESPYIVRPLEDVTVNGISVDEYVIVIPENDNVLYRYAAETLNKELHKACGKSIPVENDGDKKTFIINEMLYDTDLFSLKVENGNVYISGSSSVGIS